MKNFLLWLSIFIASFAFVIFIIGLITFPATLLSWIALKLLGIQFSFMNTWITLMAIAFVVNLVSPSKKIKIELKK